MDDSWTIDQSNHPIPQSPNLATITQSPNHSITKSSEFMNLLLVGISHRTAPVDLREGVDFQVRGVTDALRSVAGRGSTREAVVVSTCNRAEVYVACDDAAATRTDLVAFLSEFHGVPATVLAPHL